jgi:hypothetical protein
VWACLEDDLAELFRLLLGSTQLGLKCLSEEIRRRIFSILLVGFQSSLSSRKKYFFKRRKEEKR